MNIVNILALTLCSNLAVKTEKVCFSNSHYIYMLPIFIRFLQSSRIIKVRNNIFTSVSTVYMDYF